MQVFRVFLLMLVCAGLALSTPAHAQDQPAGTTVNNPIDYEAWRSFARQAEQQLDGRMVSNERLAELRTGLVAFRARFLAAQDTNATRIANLREQITALGPPPEEGAQEAPEIAERRAELTEELTALQAPGIAAQEAFRRADGLIRQIDTTLRERDAEARLTLWPSPLNPVNWVAAADAIWGTSFMVGVEITTLPEDPARVREFRSNLPLSLALVLISGFVLLRGRSWIERIVSSWLTDENSRLGRRVLARLISITQIIVPVTAVIALSIAIELLSIFGAASSAITSGMVALAASYFVARWAGRQIFPVEESRFAALKLSQPRRREGRFWANILGITAGIAAAMADFFPVEHNSDAANAVLAFPALTVIGLILVRIGMLLGHHKVPTAADGAPRDPRFLDRTISILAKLLMAIGVLAPVLAGIGYVQAAQFLLEPTVLSLIFLVAILFLMQLIEDIYCIVSGQSDEDEVGLIPSLINFSLIIISLPVFALIWGVRPTELLEFWQMLREGFSIGDTRISPTNILSFIIVFSIGYVITRVLQGGLESTVLPKTKIDKGGQKAIISGVGYVGIFIAALVAISTAGIDLSGLAIVAGALSVGIGFGLQNIVSNFISGLILLIERPVAEGDWIEVGGTMGTVRSISVRSTVIETFDRTDVIVPNADLISGTVTNWTRYNSLGRVTIPVGVAYGSDTRKVTRILKEIGDDQPLAVLEPAPQVHFVGFGADSLDFELRLVLSDVAFGMSVRTEIRHQIVERFRDEGLEIPFAQRDVWLRNPEALRGETVHQPEITYEETATEMQRDTPLPEDDTASPTDTPDADDR